MRRVITLVLATSLIATSALAADNVGPLAAGKPAGVHEAQGLSTTSWVLIGVGVVTAIAVGIATGSNGSPLQNTPQLAVTTTTG
jgi:hypothetical protein